MYIDNDADLFEQEIRREQRRRDHVFIKKLRRRRGVRDAMPTADASHIGVETVSNVLSAAEFAQAFGICLDVMVTLDLTRMGVQTGEGARAEVGKFVKCYTEWAVRGPWKHPAAWIYAIEHGAAGYHAHIALFVPGWVRGPDAYDPDLDIRRGFRRWARGYTDRKFGQHIPRVVRVQASRKERPLVHWINISYLLKGYDLGARVQAIGNSPDDQVVSLGNLIATPYSNPGVVTVQNRVRVCHALGPAQRKIGAPTGMEWQLPRQPNWRAFQIDRAQPLTLNETLTTDWTIPKPMPFQSRWDGGHRDVRNLYPPEFYSFVTGQAPYDDDVLIEPPEDTLASQLLAMADW